MIQSIQIRMCVAVAGSLPRAQSLARARSLACAVALAWVAALGLGSAKVHAAGAPGVAASPTAGTEPASPALPGAAARRPNVIFVLIDDMGYGDLGCYGNKENRTPNLDRLAAEGIRFTQYYTSAPICSPSRVALTTGRYPARYRIGSFIAARAENQKRGVSQWLAADAPTLARTLKSAGYRTGHFGKWHMGGGRDVGEAPLITQYGFDESLTQFEGLGDRLLCTFDTLFPNQPHNAHPLCNQSAKLGRGKVEYVKRPAVTQRFVDRSVQFAQAARDAGEPFYINLWPDDVHTPCEPSSPYRGDGSNAAMFRGAVEELDAQLGPLLDLVRNDEKLKNDTMIVVASDNGHDPLFPGAAGLRGHKGTLYEGGIREPFIVWYPGRQAATQSAGKVDEKTLIAGVDFAPTVLALAGVSTPASARFDGMARADAFVGAAPSGERATPLFWSRPPDRPGPKGALPDLAVRQGRWKLLVEADGSNAELFDVMSDPTEKHDVAASNAGVAKELSAKVLAWSRTMPQPLFPALPAAGAESASGRDKE